MEWKIRLEARTGWGEVKTYEIGVLDRDPGDLTSSSVGLSLAEAKAVLAELQLSLRAYSANEARKLCY